MFVPARARTAQARRQRAERILDSAADLLRRWGYNRVTIDDVAAHAGIGKGTIYLHWKTREELFFSAILREYTGAIDEIIAAVRGEPREVQLHRMVRLKYLSAMRRPLLRAVVSADPEVLGRLAAGRDSEMARLQDLVSEEYLQILIAHRLVRPGLSVQDLTYGVGAITAGFLMADSFLGSRDPDRALEQKADLLEAAIKRTFAASPSVRALRGIQEPVTGILVRGRDISEAYLQRAYDARLPGRGETA
jgi:AcrR family transcriptional regulator